MQVTTPQVQIAALRAVGNGRAMAVILAASAAVFGFLCWLLYVKQPVGARSTFLDSIPAINATLNGVSTVLLCCGLAAILRRRFTLHMRFMFAALCSSALFLVGYVVHHYNRGNTLYNNHGPIVRPAYYAILISHVVLSAVVVPLILRSFYLSLSGQYALHRRVSRFTFPIWLYVSVTGVVVFAFLRFTNHP